MSAYSQTGKRGPPEKAGLSRLTGILSGYLSLMRLASACRFSAQHKVTHVGSETGGSIKALLTLATALTERVLLLECFRPGHVLSSYRLSR